MPLPEPLPPESILTQIALLVAFHEQSLVVVTLNSPGPPALLMVWLVGESVYRQALMSCRTVTVCPATVSVPVRLTLLGATE